jgi:UDP-3-O-[3-hydroxymyristoyl] N-acetylglucosamine deacetylase/3-hydroxyacyl-[acyl-carrier-protein] dehydratase
MDGSSKYFVEAAEIEEQNAKRNIYVVKEVISFTDEVSGSEILVMPNSTLQW